MGGTIVNRGPGAGSHAGPRRPTGPRLVLPGTQFGLRGPAGRPSTSTAVLANSARGRPATPTTSDFAARLLSGSNWSKHLGPVRFHDAHTVPADDGRSWRGDRSILAVGGRAVPIPVPGGQLALGYNDLRSRKALPERGYGDRRRRRLPGRLHPRRLRSHGLAARVRPDLFLPRIPSISAALRAAFEARGMRISTGTRATALGANK